MEFFFFKLYSDCWQAADAVFATAIAAPLAEVKMSYLPLNLTITLVIYFAGQQTPELPDLRAGSGRFCSADPEPQGHFTGSSAQPRHRSGRLLWRDAFRLVQDEIPSYSCWVRHYCILGIWT